MPKRSIRKCSICRKPGHTKSACKYKEVVLEKAKKNDINKNGKTANRKRQVVVRVSEKAKKSPHIVDLKDQKEKDIWENVFVYNESGLSKKKVITQTIDLAQTVREANKKTKFNNDIQKINSLIKGIKKVRVYKIKKKKERIILATKEIKKIDNSKFELQNFLRETFHIRRFAYQVVVFLLIIAVAFPVFGYYNKLKAVGETVVEESTDAFMALQASTVAAFQSDLGHAEQELMNALQSFSRANSILEKDYNILVSVAKFLPIVGTQISSRQNLLTSGSHLALGNTYLIKGIEDAQKNEDLALTERFEILRRHLGSALLQYREALDYLNQVDLKAVPVEYQQAFGEFKILFGTFINDMEDLVGLSKSLNTIFGDDSFKRYLIVFQNHHELRPTGGFMGSFAIVDVQKGKILNIDVPGGGTYDLRGQLTEFVKPPLPLQLLNKRWEFQDANWFPDFSVSAKKMQWFYENSRGATVDGVIAINASVLERVLKVLGPIEAQQILLDQNDALEKLQYKVEVDYDENTEQPKDILTGVLDQLLLTLQDIKSVDIMNLLTELHEALQEKELQVQMNDIRVQKQMRSFGWTGEIIPTQSSQDYLSVIHTNIQGQKSDAKISQTINHEAVVDEDGGVVDTVVIERTHSGIPGEQFYGGVNISYVRVYVPEGAQLISADGFIYPPEHAFRVPEDWYDEDPDLKNIEEGADMHVESGTKITHEFGKTVFGNWIITEPGETSEVYFRYKLLNKVPINKAPEDNFSKWQSVFIPSLEKETSRYSLFVQKQSGINSNFFSTIIYPASWVPVWKSNDDIDLALNGARYDTILKTDEVVGVVMEKDIK